MILTLGGGPIGGPTSHDGTGLRSLDAIRWDAERGDVDSAPLPVPAAADLQGHRITAGEALRYALWPDLDADFSYAATWAAVDLVLDDGTLLGQDPRDQYGMSADPVGRGRARITWPQQWNDVLVDLSPWAGRTISEVRLAVAPPAVSPAAIADLPAETPPAAALTTGVPTLERTGGWVDVPRIERLTPPPDALDPATDLVALVDTRRGTNANGSFSRGNTLPLTAWPNGFCFWTPVTDARTNRWPYEYHRTNGPDNRPRLQGIGISHQPSPWMGDRNQLFLMPLVGHAPSGDPERRARAFFHEEETARPDRYRVALADTAVIDLAPTDHGGILEIGFAPGAEKCHLLIEGIDEECGFTLEGTELSGWVDNGPDGEGRSRMYVSASLDPAPIAVGPPPSAPGDRTLDQALMLTFPSGTDSSEQTLTVRLATSFISVDQARHTRELELDGCSPEEIRDRAHAAWSERLGVVRPAAATWPQLRTLYGCLYRLSLYPNSQAENAGTAQQPQWIHASPVVPPEGPSTATHTGAAVREGPMQVNNGFWDTYRTAWPAYALLYPELAAQLIDGFVQQAREGGWIARWSSPGYADLMTGTSSDVAFADAHARGVALLDPLGTYEAGLRNATVVPEHPAVGRKGQATSMFSGYVNTDVPESVSWALEGYLNDFGLAGMAERLADDASTPADRRRALLDEAVYLRRRCLGYVHLFDPSIGFFQGRRPDGSFAQSPQEFDPLAWGGDFTETDAWNFAFHVPHDPEGLATLHGGRAALAATLATFFTTAETGLAVGGYGGVIHEMTEARDVRMGQFGFSNQPAHHIPFIHNYAEVPGRTQEITREVLARLFVGEEIGQGYPGDEDNGEMSAWFILAALGVYPLRMGAPEWSLTAPLFARAEVRPLGGPAFTVLADGASPTAVHIQQLEVDGREHRVATLPHSSLRGELRFRLGEEDTGWAEDAADAPPSLSVPGQHPQPWRDLTRGAASVHPELVDDDARTEAVLEPDDDGTSTIELALTEAGAPEMYTLTSASMPGHDPSAWRLEGRTADGAWHVLDERRGESFRWRRQLRPFSLTGSAIDDAAEGAADERGSGEAVPVCTLLRLVITDAAGPPILAGLELLA